MGLTPAPSGPPWASRPRPPDPHGPHARVLLTRHPLRPAPRHHRHLRRPVDHDPRLRAARYRPHRRPRDDGGRPPAGAGRDEVARRAAGHGRLRYLANDGAPHAVAVPALGLTALAFWRPGGMGGLTVSRPAGVLLRRQGRTVTLGVSEPTRTGEPVEREWDHPVREVLKAPESVEIPATEPHRRFRVHSGGACATHTCEAALS
ncbi:hypothetical protein HTV80_09025 [Streptomyces sp. Vc74B-19]|uniref:polysaccharide lyase beta-sandwich domain-containing protein n=1 Tax=unclassified Streptomyces TaxID=2593676 RepID=UPI001E288968|nr:MULTISPECIES: polysaccharide lyase beta-sandwich domain-containing protein [unclassified Streptomyces]MBT3163245.1 hypothetical protein [Streptomyces sp. Vc74B-19]